MKTLTKNLSKLVAVKLLVAALFFTSCDESGKGPKIVEEAITIGCQYFNDNPNAILVDNPNAPIDYIVTCKSTSIPDDVVIEPGVTIAFETNAGLWVRGEGSLKAVGTSGKPITFTGVDKAKGAWGGIFFASNDPKNEMQYTTVEYAGGAVSSSGTSNKGGVVIGSGASLKFLNNTVQHCSGWALNLYYSANATNTTIENNTFKNNEIPIQISSPFIGLVKGSNQFFENTVNKVEVRCEYPIDNTQTIHKLSVPYSITNGSFDFRIGGKGQLTVEPGTVIEMGEGKRIYVYGSMKMAGTPSEKIIVRGATEAPGSWGRIVFDNTKSPNNQIQHAEIRHAGSGANATTTHYLTKGAIVSSSASRIQIDNTHFQDILSCIISADHWGTANLTVGPNITKTNVNTAGVENCAY
jgi:hypothetical protein